VSEADERPDVIMIHRLTGTAVLTNNTTVPVTHWFGRDGESCDPMVAVSCVAGSEDAGWFSIDLEQFCYATVH
jgi:hypothetical protein